jgi:hypothetical protein
LVLLRCWRDGRDLIADVNRAGQFGADGRAAKRQGGKAAGRRLRGGKVRMRPVRRALGIATELIDGSTGE